MAFKSNLLFDVLANVLCDKSYDKYKLHIGSEDFATASKFMILRYLTMSNSINVRNIVLEHYFTLEKMPETILYKWLLQNIPQQPSGFIRYIK